MQSPNSNQLNIIKVSGDAYYDSVASIKNFVFYGFNTYSNEHNTYYRCNYSKNEVEQFHVESQASIKVGNLISILQESNANSLWGSQYKSSALSNVSEGGVTYHQIIFTKLNGMTVTITYTSDFNKLIIIQSQDAMKITYTIDSINKPR